LRYHGTSLAVTAREAAGAEWDEIWDRGCAFYAGYAAYARRIKDRPIHIFVLSPAPS
jgi:hypothetical protein